MGSGTLLCPTPAAQRPSGAGRGESRSWADLGEGGALEVRGSSGDSQGAQCTRALGRCERHAPERLGRRGAGCGTSPSKARATDAVVTGLCRGYLPAVRPSRTRVRAAALRRVRRGNRRGIFLQSARLLPVVRGAAHGGRGDALGRRGAARGARTSMGLHLAVGAAKACRI